MKQFVLLFILGGFTIFNAAAQVAINTDGGQPHASSMLEVKSTSKGVLVSRMATSQRTGIGAPADGLLVYDTDTHTFWFYKAGTGWTEITNGGFAIPYTATANDAAPLFNLTNSGIGGAVSGKASATGVGAVVGQNDGGGYGVRGLVSDNTSNTAIAVYGQAGLNNGKGRAARFENTNSANTQVSTLEVETNASGDPGNSGAGAAALFVVNNISSIAPALHGKINSVFSNIGSAGVFGEASGLGGAGGSFYASNAAGNGNAVSARAEGGGYGVSSEVAGNGTAFFGRVPVTGTGYGAKFENLNPANPNTVMNVTTVANGNAANFKVNNTSGTSAAVRGEVNSQYSNGGTAGIMGVASGAGGYAGYFHATSTTGNASGIFSLASGYGDGVSGVASKDGDGVHGHSNGLGSGIKGSIGALSTGHAGSFYNDYAALDVDVVKIVNDGIGNAVKINTVGDASTVGVAVTTTGINSNGIKATADNGNFTYAIWGLAATGDAGHFTGDVAIVGNLSKSSGTFKIDHPQDPENKYLIHSFVESPDMMNVYNGNITTDGSGNATVSLPAYFQAENIDFKYQLTVIGQFAQAMVLSEISNDKFEVKTDKPNVKVSWQVTGVRNDKYAQKHRIVAEVDKRPQERGYYLNPESFDLPETRSIDYARGKIGADKPEQKKETSARKAEEILQSLEEAKQ
jgi:hypothetical protein